VSKMRNVTRYRRRGEYARSIERFDDRQDCPDHRNNCAQEGFIQEQ
jgi:hypothetical protein